jgi:dolichol-phosphate mannosyltransferase
MITILIPIFEEKKNLEIAIKNLNKVLFELNFEILFVDDNSLDGTYEELLRLRKLYPNVNYFIRKNNIRDLTDSFKYGLNRIETDYTCVIDCDLQHEIEKIPLMINLLINEKYDLIIGSRFIGEKNDIKMPFRRLFLSKIGIFFLSLLNLKDIKDPLSGFFLFRTKKIQSISEKINTKGFKVLLTILVILKKDLRILEIQTSFKKRKFGKSKLNLKTKINFVRQVFILFLQKNW